MMPLDPTILTPTTQNTHMDSDDYSITRRFFRKNIVAFTCSNDELWNSDKIISAKINQGNSTQIKSY